MVTVDYFRGKEYTPSSNYKDYRIVKGKTKYKAKHKNK